MNTEHPGARTRLPSALTGSVNWYLQNERFLLGLASVVGFFVIWQIAAEMGLISRLFFSSPIEVARAGIQEVQLPGFWASVQASGLEFLVGYLLAAVLGIPLGLAIGWFPTLNSVLDPWLSFFYSLPRIALLPVILLWLGFGIWSIIVLVFLGAFFSITVNVVQGARVVDARLENVTKSYGASGWTVFRTLVFPSSVPMILIGLRLGVARAITGVVIGELFAAAVGLGRIITFASNALQMDRVLFVTILLIGVGVGTVEILRRFEQRFSSWRDDLASTA